MKKENDIENEEEEEEEEEDEETEEVTLTEKEEQEAREFTEKVKRMCRLETQIKEMNTERKVLADEKNELRAFIINYMAEKRIGDVNFGEDEVLYLDNRETAGSLTRKTLLAGIKDYFQVGELDVTAEVASSLSAPDKEGLSDAQELFDHIQSFVGKSEKVVLVRENRNKRKRERKIVEFSVYKKD